VTEFGITAAVKAEPPEKAEELRVVTLLEMVRVVKAVQF
jgi:hypothetical protein